MNLMLPLLIGLLLLGANCLTAAENLEPGLWGEYFDIGTELEDFPTVPADKTHFAVLLAKVRCMARPPCFVRKP